MLRYFDELKRTMEWLAQQPKTLFLGQTVGGPGTFMYSTLQDVSPDKRVEMPVNESFQMQFTLGLALAGYIPVSVYPRQNFLLLATADMVNMLDKMPAISSNQVLPHVIIRVAAGPDMPVHPGHQHVGNYAEAFRRMLSWVEVVELNEPHEIFPAYKRALEREDARATLLIEHGNFYNQK
jgi:pyruvate/2-oxoglutarate/acetoin dehydrogenase E1 component